MDEITEEPGALVERIAALDVGKATLTVCVRVPHEDKPGARRQEVPSPGRRAPSTEGEKTCYDAGGCGLPGGG